MKHILPAFYIIAVLILSPVKVISQVTFSGPELLCRPTSNSVTINIVPDADISQLLYEYGTTSGIYTGQTPVYSVTAGVPLTTVISGLQPDTRYYYRMRYSTDGGTNWITRSEHSFHTQRASGTTFKFSITADCHINIMLGNITTWQQTLANVAGDNSDFHIDLGDTFAMDNVTSQSGADNAYLYQRSASFFGQTAHSLPLFVVIGNHEQEEGWHLDDTGNPATSQPVLGANARKKYFPDPVPDGFYSGNNDTYSSLASDDKHIEDYFAWQWGDALFVVIDPFWYTTSKPYIGNTGGGEGTDTGTGDRWDWTLGSVQFNWLKNVIQSSAAKYKFVFAHHMVGGSDDYVRGGAVPAHLVEWGGYNEDGTTYGFTTRRPEAQWGSMPVHQLFVNNGVSAFFHGHDHQYAYEVRDGVVYLSMPAAGFSGNGFNIYNEANEYTERVLPSPGHLRVTVAPSQTTVEYIATTGGSVNHSFTINPNTPSQNYNLSLNVEPAGSGTTSPSAGTHTYSENTVVNLVATPASGYRFDHWTGNVANTSASATTITMTSDQSVTAHFTAITSVKGDLNGDNEANSTDALIILSCDVGINVSQFCPCNCGDVNDDGLVNSTDALIILSFDAGLTVPFELEQTGCRESVTPCPGCQ